jgi:chromosome segregation ATPase
VINSLRQEQSTTQKEIDRLIAALKEAEATGTDVETARAEAQKEIAQHQLAVEASNAEAARLRKQWEAARRQMGDLKSGLATAQSKLEDLESDFAALGKTIEEKMEELFITAALQSADNISQLREKLGATTDQIEKLGEAVSSQPLDTDNSGRPD